MDRGNDFEYDEEENTGNETLANRARQ